METHVLQLDPLIKDHLINLFQPLCKHLSVDIHQVIDQLCQELAKPPLTSSLRVNALKYTTSEAIKLLNDHFLEFYRDRDSTIPPHSLCTMHPDMNDVLLIEGSQLQHVVPVNKQVIVGLMCGLAVLRGADVYAPGVMGAPKDLASGDEVSVFTDRNGRCRRGLAIPYDGPTVHVGNGIACQSRKDWFEPSACNSGLAVKMTKPLYNSPPLNETNLLDIGFPQNLPSLIVSHVLEPLSPTDIVLDMCAAPGGKTTHIATLMNNKGVLIALDRSKSKLKTLQHNLDRFSLTNTNCFAFDSSNCCSVLASHNKLPHPPPYLPETFNKILLDAPCSGLGQRPQFDYCLSLKDFTSFPPYQRKLLTQAVELLQPGGVLLYSTCSLSPEENECQVKWVLSTFKNMSLAKQLPYLGCPGLSGYGLNDEECSYVQRFGPSRWCQVMTGSKSLDTIGFFIAKFQKNSHVTT